MVVSYNEPMSEHPCIIPEQTTPEVAVKRGIWNAAEKAALDEGLKSGLTCQQIATTLGRSSFAVDCQLATLAQAAIKNGMSVEDARSQYKFSDEALTTVKKSADKKAAKKAAGDNQKTQKTTQEPTLPFAVTPADKIAAYNAFCKTLQARVDEAKRMGANNPTIEQHIVAQLALTATLIDMLCSATQ